MISSIVDLLAPHYCCGCGKVGSVLCESCKYDIISEATPRCLYCRNAIRSACLACHSLPYSLSTYVGERTDALKRLIDDSKFESCRAGCDAQADLLHGVIPQLEASAVIVPLPTIAAHIRQRGYGHTERIAHRLANCRNVAYDPIVKRTIRQYVQHGANRATRLKQAKMSFVVHARLSPEVQYVLIDDVVTTGASMRYAARALREAGANTVWAFATSRQSMTDA